MAATSTAGVEFTGSVMRYSEVERLESTCRLLRLGNCEFEFDVASVVYSGSQPEHIKTVQSALKDVFQGTEATRFRFVLPSQALTRFTSVVPEGADEDAQMEHIAFETRILSSDIDSGDVFPTLMSSLDSEDDLSFSVSLIESDVTENLRIIGSAFPEIPFEHVPSSDAAFLAFRHVAHRYEYPKGTYLLAGAYGRNTDFVLIKDGAPLAHTSIVTPHHSDAAYHSLLLLSRFGLSYSDLKQVFVYGEYAESTLVSSLETAVGEIVTIFNPSAIVDLDENRFEDDFPIQAFVPCMGAAIQ